MTKRRPWVAFWLSLLCPGLGQLYNGSILWAVIALVVGSAASVISAVYFFSTFQLLVEAMLFGFLIDLGFALHALVQAKRWVGEPLRTFQRSRFALGLALVFYLILAFGAPDGYGTLIPERFLSFQIPSESMVPTLLVGDRLIADGWAYWHRNPQRGDVAVFNYPKDPSEKFVKRVVGLPGDTIQIRDGDLYVNGKLVPANRSSKPIEYQKGWGQVEYEEDLPGKEHLLLRSQPTLTYKFGPVTVPPDSYFMMGDNRDHSNDSRFWGFVNRSAIVGRMQYVFFSWDSDTHSVRWSRIGHQVE